MATNSYFKEKDKRFSDNIETYDIHIYYNLKNEGDNKKIDELLGLIRREFWREIEEEKSLFIKGKRQELQPMGPHPVAMVEIDFYSRETFGKIVPFLQLNNLGLDILIHPNTELGGLIDHTRHAMWIGHKQRLVLDVF
ncbi:DOPA 4,5-dioxygenase family protein [Ascoidea rubescens DSM 1968]|uniref:Dopa 4,5-dioxygenase n=1 Tax=Ascoidea rubescens DSM 1968 TaxID=1344418 RepID=A0A1D2VH70_9ASCO|nr:dopa 4,5-dioxygenase [Ascoidea rubescens DSM 1968]ODV60843.1 dopa 4,5-dioxygenase [Ascoidea rubescens DSM 1968]